MNRIKCIGAALLIIAVLPADLFAASRLGSKWFQVNNRIRLEYDDNVNQADTDEQDSFKLIVEPELWANANFEQTFLSLRYRPMFAWWSDREPDDTTLNHDMDVVFSHDFSPRVSLALKDTLRIAEQTTWADEQAQLTLDNDFMYNSLHGALSVVVIPETTLDLSGRYHLLRYDDDTVAQNADYDIYALGLDLRRQVLPETSVAAELRSETTEYENTLRDSDGYQLGAAMEQTFSPNLVGQARLGWQHKEFEDAGIEDSDTPYLDGTLTVLPSPATRLSAGLGYDQSETEVVQYANQKRFRMFGSLAYDITARIVWFLTASYYMNDLDAKEAISTARTNADGLQIVDGTENIFQFSTRLSYRLNRSNSLEAGWQLTNLDSDVRQDYLRNRLSVGWKIEI
jgi:hypothetical protein